MELLKSILISASGMRTQGRRMRVVAENIANASSVPTIAGEDPYRRKTITFKNELDHKLGIKLVEVHKIGTDNGEFGKRYDPNHPAAGSDGYLNLPNVNALIEMMDMKEAQRSYEANLNVIKSSKAMLQGTINILK